MAAATYAALWGCPPDTIRRVVTTFPGLEHALELVRERRGVRFVNDSKGTNVDATFKALEGIDRPIWLIAGGRDKGGDFSRLTEAVRRRVKHAILIGEAAPLLKAAWAGATTDERSEVLAGRSGVGSSRGSGRRCRVDVAGLREFRHVSGLSGPGTAIQIGGAGATGIASLIQEGDSEQWASRSAGTLSLPWPTSGQRSGPSRVAMDHVLLFVTLTLAFMGLVMVFSASAIVAGNRFQDPEFFLKRQIAWLGFECLADASHLAHRLSVVEKTFDPDSHRMTVLLVMVLVPSLGVAAKGARRWFRWGPISIQPAEMVKLVSVLYLATYLAKKSDKVTLFRSGLLPVLIVVGVLSGLVLLEPDLGTVVVWDW